MRELMRRIAELKAFRWSIIGNEADPQMWPAAVDWLDMTISEHEADLDAMVKGMAA